MEAFINTIFLSKNLAVSIATYLNLIENVDKKVDKLISKEYNSAIQMLEQVRYVSNPAIYSNMLVGIIDRFNQAISLEKRERLLLSHLGLMMCYFYLGETNALLMTQKKVANLQFDITFWEKNGGSIKEGSMIALGAGLAFLVAGPVGAAVGASAALGAQTGNKLKEDHLNELKYRQNRFNKLKNSILMLRFQ